MSARTKGPTSCGHLSAFALSCGVSVLPPVGVWARVPRSGVITSGVRVWIVLRHVLAAVLLL